jgi:hypothetical protein
MNRAPEIDANIRSLVNALNALPALTTFSSCGGHPEPDPNTAQVPEGVFYVCFDVAQSAMGWRALVLIAWACGEVGGDLEAWFNADVDDDDPRLDVDALCFELRGYGDPDDIETLLRTPPPFSW